MYILKCFTGMNKFISGLFLSINESIFSAFKNKTNSISDLIIFQFIPKCCGAVLNSAASAVGGLKPKADFNYVLE